MRSHCQRLAPAGRTDVRRSAGRALLGAVMLTSMLLTAPTTAAANSFFVRCASTHVSNDDPIVYPGLRGAAHRHEFFGARGVRSDSTESGLRTGTTSCATRADTAAYWAPTLEIDGRMARGTLFAYYDRGGKARAAAPPAGLKVIAGDMHATRPQRMRVTSWSCITTRTANGTRYRELPRCKRGTRLSARITFPDCWNGSDLDSADHRSHMAYAEGGRCSATHPVPIMRVTMLVVWPVRPRSAAHVTLGDGMLAATGMHADFWNTWRQGAIEQLRWDCIEVAAPCGEIR